MMKGGSAAAVIRRKNKKKKNEAHKMQRDIIIESIEE